MLKCRASLESKGSLRLSSRPGWSLSMLRHGVLIGYTINLVQRVFNAIGLFFCPRTKCLIDETHRGQANVSRQPCVIFRAQDPSRSRSKQTF